LHRSLLAAWLCALLVVAGCADGGDDEEAAPPIGEDETSEPEGDDGNDVEEEESDVEEEPVDVTEVPDEITEEYVEAVLAELEQIRTEAMAEFRAADGEMTIEVMDRLSSTFTEEGARYGRADLENIRDRDFDGVRPNEDMEAPTPDVRSILDMSEDCIFVDTEVDIGGLVEDPGEPLERIYHLVLQERELVEDYNSTPWVIETTPFDIESSREERPCTS
jgi:hypothetical protein